MPLDTTTRLLAPFLGHLTDEELDAIPYGIVQLDHHGIVRSYNAAEMRNAEMAGRPVGRDFFRDVYPGADGPEFRGRFARAVADGRLDDTFGFTFACRDLPRRVLVRMYYSVRTSSVWIFVARPDGSPLGLMPSDAPPALRPTPTHGIDLCTPRVA